MSNTGPDSKSEPQFKFETTADGSRTVRIGAGENVSEAMHSLKGAFSETAYIYGHAVETCLNRGFATNVMSMGLGLGYVELLSAGLFLKHGREFDGRGESFEIVPELRTWFRAWLLGIDVVPDEFAQTYQDIAERVSRQVDVPTTRIFKYLAGLVRDGRWKISSELSAQTVFGDRFGCICFDAFSSKTTPSLWTEEFLNDFFSRSAAPGCVLSTYACTGALKRSLRAQGFDVQIREGFSSKRDSTFAVREP